MRILILTHAQFVTLALPKYIEMAEVLVSMGHSVTLVATSRRRAVRSERFLRRGVQYVISPSLLLGRFRHGADPYDALRRIALLWRDHFDIIHAVDSRPSVILPALVLRRVHHAPLVIEWTDLYSGGGTISERSSKLYQITLGKIESFFELNFRKYADGATAISSYLRKRLVETGFDQRRILLLRTGCIIDDSKITAKGVARKKLGLDCSKIYIGYLGRIYPMDHELLIHSFELLSSERRDVELILVGQVDERFRRRQDHVTYTGFVGEDRYNDYCNAIDFFVLPFKQTLANRARWPSKIGDYLSYAKPIVSTKVSDIEEVFRDAAVGVLSTSDGSEDFSSAMKSMIDNKSLWESWGRNALGYAKANLDWSMVAAKLVAHFENALNQSWGK
jgi:glycosyltransferase involved in cell wall biosynthesis